MSHRDYQWDQSFLLFFFLIGRFQVQHCAVLLIRQHIGVLTHWSWQNLHCCSCHVQLLSLVSSGLKIKLCMLAKKFKNPRLNTDCWYFLLGKNCFHGSNQTTGSSADTSVLQDHGNPTGVWSHSSISAWYVMITMHRTTWWRWPGMLQWTKEATPGYQRESSSSLRRWRRKDFESFTFCQLFVLLG